MNRFSRSLAVLALSATAVLGGVATAHADQGDPNGGEATASARAHKCDVEYTVSYYHWKEAGYNDFEAMRRADSTYNLCMLFG